TDSTPGATGSFSYTAAAGDGTYSFYTVAVDKAGNREDAPTSADTSTFVDTTAPVSSASSPAYSSSTTISVSYSASDVGSGLDKVELWAEAPGASSFSKVATDTIPVSGGSFSYAAPLASGSFSYMALAGDGTYSFYTIAVDKAGNTEAAPAAADTTTLLDTAAPSSSASSPQYSTSTTITVGYSAFDPGATASGLKTV